MRRLLTWGLCALAACWTLNANGQVPERLQYQGYLKTAAGTPVDCTTEEDCPDGPYTMTMRLYADSVGGVPVWEEIHSNVSVKNGIFRLTLGETEPLVADTLPNALWLGIVINGGTESSPRQQVVSSAFAFRANEAGIAQDADALGGLTADSYATKNELPGLCVTQEVLSEALATLSDEAPYFTTADVEVVLVDGGYLTLNDIATVAVTGSYLDLSDTPAVLDSLAVNAEGSLVFAGTPLINSAGEWIGPATGLAGPQGEKGTDGAPGIDGISISSAEVNTAGELVIVLSDGTITTSNPLVGPAGPQGSVGAQGPAGEKGETGETGADGAQGIQGPIGLTGADGAPGIAGLDGLDGVSVNSAEVNSSGELVIELSDGTTTTSASLTGPAGAQGPAGTQGPAGADGAPGTQGPIGLTGADGAPGIPGTDGADGVSVVSALVNGSSQLVITLSNGSTFVSGSLKGDTGEAGATGPAGPAGSLASFTCAAGEVLVSTGTDWECCLLYTSDAADE